ncbi:hypothetical protein HD806DRAFT_434162 [Xylariaceae sp. AK1471]|nr:hypothetical protein HD806DRAFT_434162 [Xylariaceae sp. AK1471]
MPVTFERQGRRPSPLNMGTPKVSTFQYVSTPYPTQYSHPEMPPLPTATQRNLYQDGPEDTIKKQITQFFYDRLPFAACGMGPADVTALIEYNSTVLIMNEHLEFDKVHPETWIGEGVDVLKAHQIHVKFPPGSPSIDKWEDIFKQLQHKILHKYNMLDTVVEFTLSEKYGHTYRWYPPKLDKGDLASYVGSWATGEPGDRKELVMPPLPSITAADGGGWEPKAQEQERVSEKTLEDKVEEEGDNITSEAKKRETRVKGKTEVELDRIISMMEEEESGMELDAGEMLEKMLRVIELAEKEHKEAKMLEHILEELKILEAEVKELKDNVCREDKKSLNLLKLVFGRALRELRAKKCHCQ